MRNDNDKLKCVKRDIDMSLDINHSDLCSFYNLRNIDFEMQVIRCIDIAKLHTDENGNRSALPLVVIPVAEFELEDNPYQILLFGQYYFQFLVCSISSGNFMNIDADLSEFFADELFDRSHKFEHQNLSISFIAFIQNYLSNHMKNHTFKEYWHLKNVAEECFYLDIDEY